MSDIIKLIPYNASHVKIETEMHVYHGLDDHFKFHPDGYRFIPAFRNKQWDGYVHLFNIRSRLLPLGLIHRLENYADLAECQVDLNGYQQQGGNEDVTAEDIQSFADSIDIHSQGKKIIPHDYQIESVALAIQQGRMVAIAPTSAGKSLILYIYLQWFLQREENKKILLIVPSVSLVHQMAGDFKDYQNSPDDSWFHLITAGADKHTEKQVTISTWQSLQNLAKENDPAYFKQWDIVAVDEVHTAKGKVLANIMDICINAHIRLGVTGTLDGTQLSQIQLEGIFGMVHHVITTKELMDRGAVASMDIKCLILDYPAEEKALCKDLTYQEEIDFIITHPTRLNFLANLAVSMRGNTLLLLNHVGNHGDPLYKLILTKVAEGRKVFFIHGGVKGTTRNDIRAIVDQEEDAIVVASYGTCSTGISIRRLHNVIFGSPSKSQIRVLQSLGRGLRLGTEKTHCTLYDITDDLSHKKKKNYTLTHSVARITMYSQQQFNYKLIKVPMK